jgi:hypothetical protein
VNGVTVQGFTFQNLGTIEMLGYQAAGGIFLTQTSGDTIRRNNFTGCNQSCISGYDIEDSTITDDAISSVSNGLPAGDNVMQCVNRDGCSNPEGNGTSSAAVELQGDYSGGQSSGNVIARNSITNAQGMAITYFGSIVAVCVCGHATVDLA